MGKGFTHFVIASEVRARQSRRYVYTPIKFSTFLFKKLGDEIASSFLLAMTKWG